MLLKIKELKKMHLYDENANANEAFAQMINMPFYPLQKVKRVFNKAIVEKNKEILLKLDCLTVVDINDGREYLINITFSNDTYNLQLVPKVTRSIASINKTWKKACTYPNKQKSTAD